MRASSALFFFCTIVERSPPPPVALRTGSGGRPVEVYARCSASMTPIELVAEVQLHLTYYLQQRKKTHLWFKILRAADLESLRRDCAEYAYM